MAAPRSSCDRSHGADGPGIPAARVGAFQQEREAGAPRRLAVLWALTVALLAGAVVLLLWPPMPWKLAAILPGVAGCCACWWSRWAGDSPAWAATAGWFLALLAAAGAPGVDSAWSECTGGSGVRAGGPASRQPTQANP
jgi:hypothetical protein